MVTNMKKSIYIGVITLITIGCVIYGVNRYFGGGFSWSAGIGNNAANIEESAALDKYDRMDIDMAVADITIVEGTDYRLDYSGTDNLELSYRVDKGVLKIEQKTKRNIGVNNATLELTVPNDAVFDKVDISSDVGDINIEGMDIDYYISDTDVGDTLINGCKINDVVLESDTGDVSITECELNKADIQTDVGEIGIETCSFKNLDIESEVGDIVIESDISLEDFGFDLKTDVGNVEINHKDMDKSYNTNGNAGKIEATGDVGDIIVNY